MGNCCTNSKKSEKPSAAASSSSPQDTEKSHQRYLKFQSKSQNFSYKLEYYSNKSLSTYLNHIILNHPELTLENLLVSKKQQEFHDFYLTLQDLEIFPSDVISIETSAKVVSKKSFDESNSADNEEIAEEESTTKFQVTGIKPKLNIAEPKSKSGSVMLWKSAMNEQKVSEKIVLKEGDASSLINPMDLTIENKLPVYFENYEIKNGQSVLIDSDDSYLKNDVKGRDSMHRHPYDFFRDLQGPFSVLRQI